MAFLGTHVLLISHDFPPTDDRDFNEWYIREHMPERVVGLPGFNRGRRFRTIDEGPKYLAFYETTDARALASEPYLRLVRNFDPRSRLFVPRFRSTSRTVSVVRASTGMGEGGVLGLVGFETDDGAAASLRSGAGTRLADDLLRHHGVTGAHLLESDIEALTHSRQGHLRQNDLVLPWTLLIEALDEVTLNAVWHERLAPANLATLGAGKVLVRGRYRMLFSLAGQQTVKPSE